MRIDSAPMRGAAAADRRRAGFERGVLHQRVAGFLPALAALEHVGQVQRRPRTAPAGVRRPRRRSRSAPSRSPARRRARPSSVKVSATGVAERGGAVERGQRLVERHACRRPSGRPQPDRPERREDRARLGKALGGAAQREDRGIDPAGPGVGRADGHGALGALGFERRQGVRVRRPPARPRRGPGARRRAPRGPRAARATAAPRRSAPPAPRRAGRRRAGSSRAGSAPRRSAGRQGDAPGGADRWRRPTGRRGSGPPPACRTPRPAGRRAAGSARSARRPGRRRPRPSVDVALPLEHPRRAWGRAPRPGAGRAAPPRARRAAGRRARASDARPWSRGFRVMAPV